DPFNRLNPACFLAPSPGSIGLESGINYLYAPGALNFDMSLQKEFNISKSEAHPAKIQLRVDAFNIFNHTIFTGYNSTLNYNAYSAAAGNLAPGGIITGQPTLAATALGRNPNGSFNVTGFGTVTQTVPGALGYSRILQTIIRVQF